MNNRNERQDTKTPRRSLFSLASWRLGVHFIAFLMCIAPSLCIAEKSSAPAPDHVLFDNILKEAVKDERVDYVLIKAKHLDTLKSYLDQMSKVPVILLEPRERLAAYINVYNATLIKAVVDRYKPGYSVSEENYKIFKEPLVRVDAATISLDDLENKVIRPKSAEPRVHVALVCGARSCPPILNRPYRGEDVDQTLEENMKRFITDGQRNQIDRATKKLKLSRIFEWYAKDFGDVKAYVGKYVGIDTSAFEVSYLDYSWALNDK